MRSKFKLASYVAVTAFLTLGFSISLQSLLAEWAAPLNDPPTQGIHPPVYNESAPLYADVTINKEMFITEDTAISGNVGIGGSLLVGSNSLWVNSSTGNVGIGRIDPGALLDIYSNTTEGHNEMFRLSDSGGLILQAGKSAPHDDGALDIYDNAGNMDVRLHTGSHSWFNGAGYLGVGTNEPTANLDINGTLRVRGGTLGKVLTSDENGNATWQDAAAGGTSQWITSGSNIYYNSGDVAIGKTAPLDKLDVNGNISLSGGGKEIHFRDASGNTKQFIWHNAASNYLGVGPGGSTNSIIVTAAGDVGLGTINPGVKLDVVGNIRANNGYLAILNTGVSQATVSYTSGKLKIGMDSAGTDGIYFNTYSGGYADRMVIKSSGNVGVGTVSPSQKLDVVGYVKGQSGLCIGNDCRASWPSGGGFAVMGGSGLTCTYMCNYYFSATCLAAQSLSPYYASTCGATLTNYMCKCTY